MSTERTLVIERHIWWHILMTVLVSGVLVYVVGNTQTLTWADHGKLLFWSWAAVPLFAFAFLENLRQLILVPREVLILAPSGITDRRHGKEEIPWRAVRHVYVRNTTKRGTTAKTLGIVVDPQKTDRLPWSLGTVVAHIRAMSIRSNTYWISEGSTGMTSEDIIHHVSRYALAHNPDVKVQT